ncbi:MAG TPA: hypothetical protein VJM34_07475, partial [Novosphingobium sp.]|nr:hypothetical protein [Novosphingobium sp.]
AVPSVRHDVGGWLAVALHRSGLLRRFAPRNDEENQNGYKPSSSLRAQRSNPGRLERCPDRRVSARNDEI